MKIEKLMLILLIIFISSNIHAEVCDAYLPKEMLLFKLPNNEAEHWKSIARHATTIEGLVEYIPLKQISADWVDLIAIQYINMTNKKLESQNPIDEILDAIKKSTIAAYQGSKVIWNVIEKKEGEAIYEWILPCQHENVSPQHEIVHIFYHMSHVHRVGFTHKNEKISAEDRVKWIRLLSESVSFISQQDPKFPSEELSLIARAADSIDYGVDFSDWKVAHNWMFENNVHYITSIPVGHDEANVTECIEIITMPRGPESKTLTMDQAFQMEKSQIKSKLGKEPNIQILEKSIREIVYTYQYPHSHDNLIVTEVVRVRVAPNFYLSIHYKKGLPNSLSYEEILMKKKQIESIKYRSK